MKWYFEALRKYAVFHGRARRREFWLFTIINTLIGLVLASLDGTFRPSGAYGALTGLYALATLIPSLAVSVRRLHDTDRSGWWLLISLVPFIGYLVLLVVWLLDGDHGSNRYGPNPRTVTTDPPFSSSHVEATSPSSAHSGDRPIAVEERGRGTLQ